MSELSFICSWALIILHADTVSCGTIEFLARDEGDTALLSCLVDHTTSSPIGVSLKRSWLQRTSVLFKYEGSEVSILDQGYHNRTSVSGDPKTRVLNVTISGLRASDTDRYYCEFNLNNPQSEDTVLRGTKEFVLFVSGVLDVDRDWINTCAGSSALLPCVPPVGDSSAVEGVILKRQRGQRPMELLYNSKQTFLSSQFFVDRVQLSTAPGPKGISYTLTVGALQPEDSGLYSCQLLLQGRPHSPSMGPHRVYVSVQGDQCGCSGYSTLIYALSAVAAVTCVLLVVSCSCTEGIVHVLRHTPQLPFMRR
ncbi:hypothetical protein WMY93_006335 [Mugilogobius chulae]|uniref:Ig-like domain-containing protein n=1 Tax=Mugilogobius chulae TaxID=88201 RepID=A0AAW0PJD3_9GOBI